ncbi:phosphohistidine phosphatase SixA [Deltaproteobacteria bacterium TL4]
MKLFIVRHGQAHANWDDSSRPLSERGVMEVRKMASFLKSKESEPITEVWHSTKLRASQTATELVKSLGLTIPVREMDFLTPNADTWHIAAEIATLNSNLMIVSHLPYVSKLTSCLVNGHEDSQAYHFDTGSIFCLGRESESPKTEWRIQWMESPSTI